MYGAILGDMIGSPYEFHSHNYKAKDFPLFCAHSRFTDDSVMTLAVAQAFYDAFPMTEKDWDDPEKLAWLRHAIASRMRIFGTAYPDAGYGGHFHIWLRSPKMGAYNSYGNGSAMRVSAAAWFYNDLATVRRAARISASVTHDHPEGIKGAESIASAVFLARTGKSKAEIKAYIEREFSYDLSRSCDEIRPEYEFDVSCQGSVPEAITAFLEGESFEDVIRTAVSLGGDSDTIACMAGAIAEGFYGVPDELKAECRKRLDRDLLEVLDRVEAEIEDRLKA